MWESSDLRDKVFATLAKVHLDIVSDYLRSIDAMIIEFATQYLSGN
jgi:hypothetical protein